MPAQASVWLCVGFGGNPDEVALQMAAFEAFAAALHLPTKPCAT